MEATEVISVQAADGSEVQLSAAQLQNVNVVDQSHHQQMLNHQVQVQVHAAQQQQLVNQALLQGALVAAPNGVNGVVNNNGTNARPRMDFTETRRGNDLLEYVRKSRDHDKYCDVLLYVHGRQFKAHRVVLSSASPYFDSIFQSREAANSSTAGLKLRNVGSNGFNNGLSRLGKETLSVACQEPEVFSTFLNYIYTGVVSIDKSNVGELMRLSNHFLVNKLKGYCGEFLERFLDAENCLQIKDVAEKFHMSNLAKSATAFVQNNLGEVINHEIMMELPPKQIERFVSEKAWAVPQDAAVKFMSRWVCHDLNTRERDFKQLLTNIDWNTMDPNIIVDYIDQEPLYGSSERCFYYVLHSLAEKGIQVQKYEQMYQALQQRFGQEMDQPLGFGDNLLQMAFNSAMEGLQVPADSTSLLMPDGREGGKWQNENDGSGKPKPKRKALSLEQRRKRILARIQRNRAVKKWVVVRMDKPKRKKLAYNEIVADSSGEEECDPIQTSQGYRCHICPFVTKKVSRLERHLATVHGHDVTYRCTECGFTCKWNREYFLHMKSHYEGPPYKCHACEFNCQKIGSLIAHKVTHIDLKPYQCSECEYKCRTKANLAVHIKTHNNEKPYRCNICGRNFASKNSLDQHAIGHNTDKTYSCTQCPFSTKYLNHFTNHKKTHHTPAPSKKTTGELYRCQDPQCKYTTSKKSQLDSHMRSHAGVRPHVCSICGRRFLEKSHLVRHERIHFNERPFKCEECDYASTRRDKLKEHKTRHHGINASAKSPYKPRPHKNNKQSYPPTSEQNLVYAKKSTVAQQQTPGNQVSQQEQTVAATVAATATGELEFIIPHGTHITNVGQAIATSEAGGTTAYAQLTGASTIDLHQMANGAGIVQLRPFQPGKPEIQVAHTLASIPASMSAQDLQRTLGVKLEDLQAQGLIGIQQAGGTARAIKIEELTGSVQVTGQTQGGLPAGTRVHHGTTTTMVLDAAQLQQLAQAAAGNPGAFERITIASAPANSNNNNQSSGGNSQGGNQNTEFAGLSTLLY